jgi:hypothetical protein
VPWGAHHIIDSDVSSERRSGFRDQPCQLQENGPTAPPAPIEQRQLGMAAAIRWLSAAAGVRLYSCGEAFGYGSRGCGEAGPDSDVDLLIKAPDARLASCDRFALIADPWGPLGAFGFCLLKSALLATIVWQNEQVVYGPEN